MKVVLPLPAMPTQTIATGEFEVLDVGADASGAVEADILKLVSLLSGFRHEPRYAVISCFKTI
jgi:hypothetical protein